MTLAKRAAASPHFIEHAGRNLLSNLNPGQLPVIRPPFFRRCSPRVLMVCDTGLSFNPSEAFSLSRFIEAITTAPGVTLHPVLTLAHRSTNNGVANVTIGGVAYPVHQGFTFDDPAMAVDVAHYDQIWIFADGGPVPTNAEVGVISAFMNKGGGVFATGDHATLGFSLCGRLPRIRAMREWQNIPMGLEPDALQAAQRIDTVVDPGSNALYEFEDQSDAIPQRIYPNYTVIDTDGLAGNAWQASIHPLLDMPGVSLTRTSGNPGGANLQFTNDIDVLPDHPHESVCYALSGAAVPAGAYTDFGQNFTEFQPNAATPALRVGSDAVGYGVAGGRSVLNGGWKPPVHPRMFTIISAYDGRLAQPYAGNTQPPGRIVCDSTWHHFLNINLDGTGTARQGLGSWSGGTPGSGSFTTGPALDKIYAYYRNTVNWLQPGNRIWCNILIGVMGLATRPEIAEELREAPALQGWRGMVALGRQAQPLLAQQSGRTALHELVQGALLAHEQTRDTGLAMARGDLHKQAVNVDELEAGLLGGLLVQAVVHFPDLNEPDEKKQADAHHALEMRFMEAVPELLATGLEDQARRAELLSGATRKHVQLVRGAMKAGA